MTNPALHNPQLDGNPFVLEGGEVGVLLIHGYSSTPVEVRGLADRLNAEGYTVAGPLLPGHNATPEEMNKAKWRDWVTAVDSSYTALTERCQTVFVGGQSTGAVLALYLASIYPEIAGVLAYSPAYKLQLSRLEVAAMHLLAPFVTALPKGEIDMAERWQGYPVNPLRASVQLLRLQREVRRRLSHIEQPVLIVQGRNDNVIDPQCGPLIMAGVSASDTEFHVIEDAGHVILLYDAVDDISDITLRFKKRTMGNTEAAPLSS